MLVSALDFDGKLEGKNLVSSFEFWKVSDLKMYVIDRFFKIVP